MDTQTTILQERLHKIQKYVKEIRATNNTLAEKNAKLQKQCNSLEERLNTKYKADVVVTEPPVEIEGVWLYEGSDPFIRDYVNGTYTNKLTIEEENKIIRAMADGTLTRHQVVIDKIKQTVERKLTTEEENAVIAAIVAGEINPDGSVTINENTGEVEPKLSWQEENALVNAYLDGNLDVLPRKVPIDEEAPTDAMTEESKLAYAQTICNEEAEGHYKMRTIEEAIMGLDKDVLL